MQGCRSLSNVWPAPDLAALIYGFTADPITNLKQTIYSGDNAAAAAKTLAARAPLLEVGSSSLSPLGRSQSYQSHHGHRWYLH